MHVIIAGGGRLGKALAELLIKEKNDVVVIEKDSERAEKLAESLDALVVNGDATDTKILKDANIESADVIVAMTEDDKTNLMVCEVAKSFKISKIVGRVNEASNEEIFIKSGISSLVNATTCALLAFKNAIEGQDTNTIALIGGGKASIIEFVVSEKSKIMSKTVGQISKNFVISLIHRNGGIVLPKPETKILLGDRVIVCVPAEEINNVKKLF